MPCREEKGINLMQVTEAGITVMFSALLIVAYASLAASLKWHDNKVFCVIRIILFSFLIIVGSLMMWANWTFIAILGDLEAIWAISQFYEKIGNDDKEDN